MSLLGADVVVLTAYTKQQNTGDTPHVFKQEPNFWYLTGIEHADWQLVICREQNKAWLIAPEIDAVHQLFDGSLSHIAAKEISGVDGILTQKEGDELLEDLAQNGSIVCSLGPLPYEKHIDFTLNPAPELLRKKLRKLFGRV